MMADFQTLRNLDIARFRKGVKKILAILFRIFYNKHYQKY